MSHNYYCIIGKGLFQCNLVNTSRFSKLFGVHISIYGALFYFFTLLFLFLAIYNDGYWLSFFLPLFGIVGFLFSVYLTIIEAFVLHLFCEFCLFSAFCTVLLLIFILIAKKKHFVSLFAKLDFWKIFQEKRKDDV